LRLPSPAYRHLEERDLVSNRPLDFQAVLQLVELLQASSNFSEVKLRAGGIEIELRRGAVAAPSSDAAASETVVPAPRSVASFAAPSPKAGMRSGSHVVKAPMVGTVYLAPEPGARSFATLGQGVAEGEQLCIVEVMKLMNAVNAERAGVVIEILVADGQAVEFGQDLFVIAPR